MSSSSVQARHSLSIKGNLNDERLKQANFSLQGSLSSPSGSSVSSVSSMTADRIVSQRAVSDSRGRDRDVSGSVTWRNATTGTRWTPGVGLSFSYGNGGSHSLQVDTAASSTTRRILSADGDGTRYNYRVNPSLSYMLFNSEHLTASLSLGLLLSGSQRGKKTLAYDLLGGDPRSQCGQYAGFYLYGEFADGNGRVVVHRTEGEHHRLFPAGRKAAA
ncbi:MAG: hypothetical protein J6O01_03100 [Bacteroidales bacterium]|nr:hypothetical protein [Bacteroidales bacterium]